MAKQQNLKIFLIIYSPRKKIHTLNKGIRVSFETFAKVAARFGFQFTFSYLNYYEGRGKFSKAWAYQNKKWVEVPNVRPDIVYNRVVRDDTEKAYRSIYKTLKVFNDKLINEVGTNKFVMQKVFPKLAIPGFIVNNGQELRSAAKKIRSDKIVLKPVRGLEGKDILVVEKNNLPTNVPKGTLAQEFFTLHGVPGLTKKVADLRVILVNGKVTVVFSRISADGFFTNQSKNGKLVILNEKRIPKSAWPVIRTIEKKFAKYSPRIYAVDFVFDAQGKPRVMEFNANPSLDYSLIDRLDLLRGIAKNLMEGVAKAVQTKK